MPNFKEKNTKVVMFGVAALSLMVVCAGQWWNATNLADNNSRMERILRHHTATILQKKKEIRKLNELNTRTYHDLYHEKARNSKLIKENTELKKGIRAELSKNEALQAIWKETVADLAKEGLRERQSSMFFYGVRQLNAERFVAKIAGLWLQAELNEAVTSVVIHQKLEDCGKANVTFGSADRLTVVNAIKAIPRSNDHTFNARAANRAIEILSARVNAQNLERMKTCSM